MASTRSLDTVETIRFQLRSGITDEDFLRRNRAVEDDYMARRPGFRSRRTARADNGEWLVFVHWASPADADATMASFFGAPETQQFLAAVDPQTVSSGRYQVVGY